MEIGITTFAETTTDPATGKPFDPATRLANLLEEVKLADEVGLDVYAVGEHHRPDFAAPSPTVILGAAAAVTKRIRLASAVTVLSTDDPVRVFEDFTTVDLLSNGRAEIWAGRGSFTETFPLFGYDLGDYDQLFAEKLDLLLKLRDNEHVTWSGIGRPPLDDLGVYPRPVQQPLPVWIGVGGNPNSVIRAGRLGLPLVVAIIGGEPKRFVPLIELYRESARAAGQDLTKLPVAINSHGFVADNADDAVETFYPSLRRGDENNRARARLVTDDARPVRGSARPHRLATDRLPAGRDRQDALRTRALQPRPLPAAPERRHDATRQGHARYRAGGHEGRACGPEGPRRGGCG